MDKRISLRLFTLTYLPSAMLAGVAVVIVLVGLSLASRGSQTPCADMFMAASVLSLTFLISGAPMIAMGARACGSVACGGAPIWAAVFATWCVTALDILRCVGWVPIGRLPNMILPFSILGFISLTLIVFLNGLWQLTAARRGPIR